MYYERKNQKDVTMGNQQERFDLELAWLAGIIEGEGWISLTCCRSLQKNNKYSAALVPQIGVVNTDERMMDKVRDIFNRLDIKYRKQTVEAYVGKDNISRKKKWAVSVSSKNAITILANSIFPYMVGIKKERVLKLFDFYKIRESKPCAGINSRYGAEEYAVYKDLYSYKGRNRSKILNDYTLNPFLKKGMI